MENTEPLNIKGARGKIEVTGVHGIFYKVLIDGEPLKPTKGKWLIPKRGGGTVELRSRGFLPGFQRFFSQGEEVFDMGGNVTIAERIVMFVPLVLLFIHPWIGAGLGILMFFMNITLVKNAAMPRVLRVALPIVNTIAAAVVLLLLATQFG